MSVAEAIVKERAQDVAIIENETSVGGAQTGIGRDEFGPLPSELLPNVDHLITEDDTPVDNFYSEKQQKFSTHVLHANPDLFGVDRSFIAVVDVGLYTSDIEEPIVPDVMVSLDVELAEDIWEKGNRSYMTWRFNKTPEIVMEIVSNKVGGEEGEKKRKYEQMRIPYYVLYDPGQHLGEKVLRVFEMRGTRYVERDDYQLPDLKLGLTLWKGKFEGREDIWLRWCDLEGNLLLTDGEQKELESQRAEQEKQRAEQEKQRAEQEKQRAKQEEQRADENQRKIEQLLAQLRALGIDPKLDEKSEEEE